MKIALISTVYNEGEDIFAWAESLRAQTRRPDEFVIVDGGSTDGTPERLRQAFSHGDFPAPRIIIEMCNIARGRNLAFQNTTADIVASIDAGSLTTPVWLEKLVEPLLTNPEVHAVGGWRPLRTETEFQKRIEPYCRVRRDQWPVGAPSDPSGGNIAFRRHAFEAAGGFPEWLTFAGEDFLFNATMNRIGFPIYWQPEALVFWEGRSNVRSFSIMVRRYGYGLGEMRVFPRNYLNWTISTICPPLILFSKRPLRDVGLRWLRNANAVWGWFTGRLFGHKPPAGWEYVDGYWFPPEALAIMRTRKQTK
ncbi:MAG: glycosyltransferase [Verrucomicrobia bacterium]|nr:glycosyltransferase [Verrucomicrobiota bacterium]